MRACEKTFVNVRHIPVMSKPRPTPPDAVRALFPGGGGCGTCWQVVRYCLVGGVNTLIDVSILNALLWRFPTHNIQLLVVENSVAYAGGAVSSFFLNKYWTFRRKQQPTRQEVGRFLISVALEILSNNALLWLAGMALSPFMANVTVWGNTSKLLAVAANAVLSYLLMRFWIFASGTQDARSRKALLPRQPKDRRTGREQPVPDRTRPGERQRGHLVGPGPRRTARNVIGLLLIIGGLLTSIPAVGMLLFFEAMVNAMTQPVPGFSETPSASSFNAANAFGTTAHVLLYTMIALGIVMVISGIWMRRKLKRA